MQSELEKKQSVEEEREKAVQAHKEETSALEQEVHVRIICNIVCRVGRGECGVLLLVIVFSPACYCT